MRNYICKVKILITKHAIARFDETVELDETDPYVKTCEAKEMIIPIKEKKPKKIK